MKMSKFDLKILLNNFTEFTNLGTNNLQTYQEENLIITIAFEVQTSKAKKKHLNLCAFHNCQSILEKKGIRWQYL